MNNFLIENKIPITIIISSLILGFFIYITFSQNQFSSEKEIKCVEQCNFYSTESHVTGGFGSLEVDYFINSPHWVFGDKKFATQKQCVYYCLGQD